MPRNVPLPNQNATVQQMVHELLMAHHELKRVALERTGPMAFEIDHLCEALGRVRVTDALVRAVQSYFGVFGIRTEPHVKGEGRPYIAVLLDDVETDYNPTHELLGVKTPQRSTMRWVRVKPAPDQTLPPTLLNDAIYAVVERHDGQLVIVEAFKGVNVALKISVNESGGSYLNVVTSPVSPHQPLTSEQLLELIKQQRALPSHSRMDKFFLVMYQEDGSSVSERMNPGDWDRILARSALFEQMEDIDVAGTYP